MKRSLAHFAGAMRGQLHGADAQFLAVSTDSRTLAPGELFVALVGPSFDGHDFVAAAAARAIAQDGCDYATAKRRAVREVLGEAGASRGAVPDNALVESELRRYQSLYQGDEQRERLIELIRQAAVKPKPRRTTKVPKAAKRQRVDEKKRRGSIKSLRRVSFD